MSNRNTIGIAIVGAGHDNKDPTESEAALKAAEDIARMLKQSGMKLRTAFGHGEGQGDRQKLEGFAASERVRLNLGWDDSI